MVPSEILTRVFRINYGNKYGSAFTIDVDQKQYLITAGHVVNGIHDGDNIKIVQNTGEVLHSVNVVVHCATEPDIAVLALDTLLPTKLAVNPTFAGAVLSQQVYFLGFPLGLVPCYDAALNGSYPLPLVKAGILSMFPQGSGSKLLMYIDGHNNRGFSGGPVAFRDEATKEWKIAGIISGYKFEERELYVKNPDGKHVPAAAGGTLHMENSGIIKAYLIKWAIDGIKAKPIGKAITSS